ncbi:MAG TPA: M48 family metalloprotease [Thermoleophilaceae bacterium]|nr:M48 family metalloprotease [Thermoleophilaceae bacterium]
MHRYHVRQVLRDARMSGFEESSFVAGMLLLVAGTVFAIADGDPGGPAGTLGTIGLGVLGVCAISRALRLYLASAPASLPRSVGRVAVRIRPRWVSTATTATFALVLPAAAAVTLVVAVDWGWLPIAGVLLLGGLGILVKAVRDHSDEGYGGAPDAVSALLVRLCMRADIPVPELVVHPEVDANAWTSGGRIHLTWPLLRLLDESELEAVLAHELAHLAHRDAAVMDVCSAPSRTLLGFAGFVGSGFRGWMREVFGLSPGMAIWSGLLAVLSVPPAFLFGWISRLSVLRMSRTREFAADAAAGALTGRPSALASALVKLDRDNDMMPRADLREVDARAILCILGTAKSRLGPLFCTHPPTAARVKRLQEIERRVHARPT